ncbi:FAD-dependent oxidoreductase [Melittangium boletus]|uniref:FAD-dependent oxidoreductase n=1 Tax=Melittangium boletus TaxID=83453 RepID=UPI003DA34A7E
MARLAELEETRGTRVDVGEEKILLVRVGDTVHAYQATCPHAGGPLEEGAILGGRILCPWHKGTFRVSDGALCEPPALDSLARYPVRVEDGEVYVSPEKQPAPVLRKAADARTFVIVGAGAAGAAAASALREFGFGGRVVLVGHEPRAPYDRTVLSKLVLSGEMPPEEVPPLRPPGFYAAQGIERLKSRVKWLDVKARSVELEDGRRLTYDAALVAPGGEPKRLKVPGEELEGVSVLRTLEDAERLLAHAPPGARAVILGNSFIGMEAASALRGRKVDVTVVAPNDIPFAKQFGEEVGRLFKTLHERNGVVFRSGTKAARLEGRGRVEAVVLESGERLAADVVLVGTGVRPATGFIEGLALREDGGLSVDAHLRAAEGLYAAGDVAAFPLRGDPVRIEHWRVAQEHARLAARNMLGGQERYEGVPFFWTYHYTKRFEYLGHATQWDAVRVVGDLEGLRFVVLLVKEGHVAAAIACDRERATAGLLERMRSPVPVDEALHLLQSLG